MAEYITPSVGTKGHYELKEPFTDVINKNQIYTCHAVRSIHDMASGGERPLESIYIKNGLTEDDYNNDLNEKVLIVTLVGDGGSWIYVPNKYIKSFPNITGIQYQGKSISINLGALPTSLDLVPLTDMLKSVVHDVLGENTNPAIIDTSSIVLIDQRTHDVLSRLRESNITQKKSYRTKYLEAEDRNDIYRDYIAKLECFIANKCCGFGCDDLDNDNYMTLTCDCLGANAMDGASWVYMEDIVNEHGILKDPGPTGGIVIIYKDNITGEHIAGLACGVTDNNVFDLPRLDPNGSGNVINPDIPWNVGELLFINNK
jgi:hypothetical protein